MLFINNKLFGKSIYFEYCATVRSLCIQSTTFNIFDKFPLQWNVNEEWGMRNEEEKYTLCRYSEALEYHLNWAQFIEAIYRSKGSTQHTYTKKKKKKKKTVYNETQWFDCQVSALQTILLMLQV